jgi:hypothetical protein
MSSKGKNKDESISSKKKPYRSPRLTNFGLVKELTTGGSGARQEQMNPGGMMQLDRFP